MRDRQSNVQPDQAIPFDRVCLLLERALNGPFRRNLVADLAAAKDLARALLPLRECMQAHVFRTEGADFSFDRFVRHYDRASRQEGLHVLNDWDGKADHVNEDIIPVDVLNFVGRMRGTDQADPTVLAILLDYYFLYLLALLSVRAWDDGDADENLDRLGGLLEHLQGPDGSGQRFADDAETLILIATSHYELEERGYDLLLDRVRTLNRAHKVKIALGHAVSMGCHLRFGFEATYGRDTVVMRDDNVADYPWLCFSLATVMDEYARVRDAGTDGGERETLVEAILNGLSADARAFIGEPPTSLSQCEIERGRFRETFLRFSSDLLAEFERYRPSENAYSPLSFFFNFSHNVLKGMVVDALLRGEAWNVTLNGMFTATVHEPSDSETKEALATTLNAYARSAPDRIRGRLMPVIVYDPSAGRQAFGTTMRRLRE